MPPTKNTKDPGLGVVPVTKPVWPGPGSSAPPAPSHEQHPPRHPPSTRLWHPRRPTQQLGHRRQAAAQKPFPWTAERTHSGLLSGLPVWRPGLQAAGSRSGVLVHVGGVWDRNSQKARTRGEYLPSRSSPHPRSKTGAGPGGGGEQELFFCSLGILV